VISHTSLHRLHLHAVQIAAGVADPAPGHGRRPLVDENGAPVLKARYSSHSLRHCAVSLWIEQRISPKRIQRYAGHHSVAYTFDTYGHLFEQAEADNAAMAAVEREVLGMRLAT
jgi:integrase